MNKPLVSVVMPTYNHARYIKEAIDSVLNQTYNNLELIIVDNFSEDDTAQIIASYNSDKIIYRQFRNNGIIAASRNHGIEQARGTYVAFLDSDDVWTETKLQRQVEAITKDPANGLSCCRFQVISDDPRENGKIMGPKADELPARVYERLIKANFVISSSTLVSKAALDDVGVFDEDPKLRCSEDFDLWLRIARKYKLTFVNMVGGQYRVHASNESGDDLRLTRALAVIDKHEHHQWISAALANQARASFYFQVGWVMVAQNSALARKYFSKARQLDPANKRLLMVCMLGRVLSFIPGLYTFLIEHRLDKKLSKRTINPQNL